MSASTHWLATGASQSVLERGGNAFDAAVVSLVLCSLPEPRMALAPVLRANASAAMDLSDGLVGDCDKLAAACGCSAAIDAESVPLDPALTPYAGDDAILARLLTAGDDYEILAAVPPEREAAFQADAAAAGVAVRRIGALVAGPGPVQVKRGGRRLPLAQRGYVHAASQAGR